VGKVEDIIVEATDANCLVMRADEAVVRGLTLRGRGGSMGSAGGGYYAVDIPQGRLELEGCVITSDALACVAIHGETADPVLRRCTIRDGAASGVLVYERARGTIEDCDIAANALAGVEIAQESAPVIRRCTVRDGRAGGIVLYEGGQGTIEDCDIAANALAGVETRAQGNAVLRGCRVNRNGFVALYAHDDGALTAEDCDLTGNAHGAWRVDAQCAVYRKDNQE